MSHLSLNFGMEVSRFMWASAMGTHNGHKVHETAAFGARGDGKTWGAFGAMLIHAQHHFDAGYPLPTRWLGAADTYASHRAKTIESLTAPEWQGRWQLEDDQHVAVFRDQGAELVRLRLFGIEDVTGMDRLRAECHGLWFEEPAPAAVLVQSSGISESAWGLGLTSRRLPTHHRPAMLTCNYPDEDHWTWQRFVLDQHAGTAYFRIPPGERATPEQRAEWHRALANRPDMIRRLLAGQPGTLLLGEQVAAGFDQDVHVSVERLAAERGRPLWIGQDGGHTPTSVFGQRVGPEVRILGAVASEHDGMRGHVKSLLLPWIGEHTPWLSGGVHDREQIQVRYDPAVDTDEQADIESNPLRVMRQMLPGIYYAGPVSWDGRKDPLLGLLHSRLPRLVIDRQARGLIKALNGAWYYPTINGRVSRDLPRKPNHPHEDYGDALCYLVAGMAPSKPERGGPRQPTAHRDFDPYDGHRMGLRRQAITGPRVQW
jgi:hypothetical protein